MYVHVSSLGQCDCDGGPAACIWKAVGSSRFTAQVSKPAVVDPSTLETQLMTWGEPELTEGSDAACHVCNFWSPTNFCLKYCQVMCIHLNVTTCHQGPSIGHHRRPGEPPEGFGQGVLGADRINPSCLIRYVCTYLLLYMYVYTLYTKDTSLMYMYHTSYICTHEHMHAGRGAGHADQCR